MSQRYPGEAQFYADAELGRAIRELVERFPGENICIAHVRRMWTVQVDTLGGEPLLDWTTGDLIDAIREVLK